jgi:hypothetical protein
MKTTFLKTILLAVTVIGAAATASAETVHATIPFEFTANGKTMPAGKYTVRTMPGSPSVLLFENEVTKMQAVAFARTAQGATGKSGRALSIAMGNATYEMSTLPSGSKLKGAVLAITPAK